MATIGIDVGGTTTRLVLHSGKRGGKGSVIRSAQHPTPRSRGAFFLKLRDYVSALLEPGTAKISAVGMGIAAVVDGDSGVVLRAPNLKFLEGVNVLDFLKLIAPRAVLANDVVVMANGELRSGAARGAKNALVVAVGTGIGGAIIIGGKIYTGQGSAGEVGHIVLDGGRYFEKLAAGKTVKKFSAPEFRRVAKYVGQALASLVNTLDPELIVLSGGLSDNHAAEFIPQAEKIMRSLILSPKSKSVRVVTGELRDFGGAVGAALMV